MVEKAIVVKLQVEGLHQWKTVPIGLGIDFLRDKHRHIFHITMIKKVKHSNRDIEIINFKRKVLASFKKVKGVIDFGEQSCEMIAEALLEKFGCSSVQVLEDGENGGMVWK